LTTTAASTAGGAPTRLADYLALTKPRLSALVLATTGAGFLLAPRSSSSLLPLAFALLGTILVVGGANALNQVYEREIDALMRRTRDRPLPAGRLWAGPAGAFGVALAAVGISVLALQVNLLSALLGAGGFVLYVFVYTPLKRLSWICTLVGAIPGATPPMIGWAAATGQLDSTAAVLFAILFFWQMPHFLAIARLFREDYRNAGMIMTGVQEEDPQAYQHMIFYCVALIPVAASLAWTGATGTVYLAGSVVLGLGFLASAVRAALKPSRQTDRAAFLYSLIYLPALLALMLIDRQII
jgi:protoheme IX farnesyltransferase